ncbi:MAG: hypothetical protein FWG59_06760 [Betaproteobacteria bacterium]|nr:hypothetical protein [Betaproteobacteria bacterium]
MTTAAKNDFVRAEIIRFLKYAPPTIRTAVLALLPAAKQALDSGHRHAVSTSHIKGWRCLLALLSSIAAMQGDAEMLLHVSNELLTIGDRMAPPEEVLRQSAEVLVQALHADLYVCRLRNSKGEWIAQFCDAPGSESTPMIPRVMDESFSKHPVAQAIQHGHTNFVVSNDLHAIEHGGQSLDCAIYSQGYRSRLAFVLSERGKKHRPFGLIMLYTRHEYGFEVFDERFLSKFARIVSLTVGRRVAVARDTLEKAAGAVAHFGNNALNVMRNHAEFCGELMEDMEAGLNHALELSRNILEKLPEDAPARLQAMELEELLARTDLHQLTEQLEGVNNGVLRMVRIINSLKKSVERPRLMHYVMGQKVLKLE